MHTEISHEAVTLRYDELVKATADHADIAHYQAGMKSQLKQLKEQALADKTITGSNAGARDAAWNDYLVDMLGPHAAEYITDHLEHLVVEAKLRQTIAQLRVEELRLHVRIAEGSQLMVQYEQHANLTGFENMYQDAE